MNCLYMNREREQNHTCKTHTFRIAKQKTGRTEYTLHAAHHKHNATQSASDNQRNRRKEKNSIKKLQVRPPTFTFLPFIIVTRFIYFDIGVYFLSLSISLWCTGNCYENGIFTLSLLCVCVYKNSRLAFCSTFFLFYFIWMVVMVFNGFDRIRFTRMLYRIQFTSFLH